VRSTASLLLAVFLSSAFLASCSSNGYGQAAAVSAVQPPRSNGRTAQTYVSEETLPCDDVLVQCNGIGSVVVSMGGGGFSITTIPASSVVDPFANGVQSTTRDLTIRAYYQSGLFFLECGDISVAVAANVVVTGSSGDPREAVHSMVVTVLPGFPTTFNFVTTSPVRNSLTAKLTSAGPNAIPPSICHGAN
jgi:hypothetical protein